ncbi:hypothetical protein ACH5RR_024486 [Cinchona calisaya]|uniref:BHLH domain-containing protein n=1 Tax=Cinchona calisaya TaxID=153742 RepID=A0ABD2YWT5_9GENT
MMAGNPNWWSMNGMHPQSHQQFPPPPLQYLYGESSPLSSNSLADHHPHQDFPRSLSQLLLGGTSANDDEHERFVASSPFHQNKKLENWEDQILNPSLRVPVADVKQEVVVQNSLLLYGAVDDGFQASSSSSRPNSWSSQVVVPASSPTSCVTSLSSNLLNFSGTKADGRHQHPENSSECNSSTAGVSKKPRIQHSSAQTVLKVRKEKLGDRITALHQLVSPFGKTDTASVLSEAIGYIRFLQAQIEALSSPYLGNVSGGGSMGSGQQASHQQHSDVLHDRPKDLRSRGLCLVPVSCTQHVGNENGADYWAPALGGGF